MTIGNLLFKTLCAVLFLVMLLCLVSCNSDSNDNDAFEILDSLGDGYGDGDEPKAADYYRIVLSGACSADVAQKSRELELLIEEKTQIDCGVVFDTDQILHRDNVIEILVGNTSRNASALALEEMRTQDFAITIVDGSIIIGGFSDTATLAALERFISDIIPYATPQSLMREEQEFFLAHTYELDDIILNGFSIGDFSISYQNNSNASTRQSALILVDLVAEKCGRVMKLYEESSVVGRRELIIKIDTVSDNSVAHITKSGEDIIISASTTYGLSLALERFCEMLFSDSTRVSVNASIDGDISVPYNAPKINAVTVISRIGATESDLAKIHDLAKKIKTGSYDVIIFADIIKDAVSMLEYALGNEYVLADLSAGCTLVYNSATVTLHGGNASKDENTLLCEAKLCHALSGEIYELAALCGNATISAESVGAEIASYLCNKDGVFIYATSESNEQIFNIDQGTMTVHYNGSLTLGDAKYRLLMLGSDGRISVCDPVVDHSDSYSALISVVLSKSYTAWYYDMLKEYSE